MNCPTCQDKNHSVEALTVTTVEQHDDGRSTTITTTYPPCWRAALAQIDAISASSMPDGARVLPAGLRKLYVSVGTPANGMVIGDECPKGESRTQ